MAPKKEHRNRKIERRKNRTTTRSLNNVCMHFYVDVRRKRKNYEEVITTGVRERWKVN